METPFQILSDYKKGAYSQGASLFWLVTWYLIGSPLIRCSILPFSWPRAVLLRIFGARIGKCAVIKPGVRIKYPWRLSVGNYSWIGEDVWIDNLALVSLGDHVCISQGAYFCTGNHNWKSTSFDLITSPINVESHAWIAAKSSIGPGVTIQEGAVVVLGSVVLGDVSKGVIVKGNPAIPIGTR